MAKLERKYLAHYIDANFGTGEPNYVRIGRDLEEYVEELNPDVETKKNILGESSVIHNGYDVSSEVSPYYYEYDETLSEKIMDIATNRLTGDACKTTMVDALLTPNGVANGLAAAWREEVMIIPSSVGGDTSGVQTPFTVYFCGNRVVGDFDVNAKEFTPDPDSTGL